MLGKKNRGLVIVNTGDGKGKTTAALGVMMRAWGHNLRVGMLQFIKSTEARYGEYQAAAAMGFEILQLGDGCLWNSSDLAQSKTLAIEAWQYAKEVISNLTYDVLVLDEFTYPLIFNWIDVGEVVEWLAEHKPPQMHIIITGRDAPAALIEFADLVTEMKSIKHPFETQGVLGQPGIEF
jgi:cob(I)alamin adenosyltransferase